MKPCSISRAAKLINHPDNIPDVDIIPVHDMTQTVPHDLRDNVGTRYNPQKFVRAPIRMYL